MLKMQLRNYLKKTETWLSLLGIQLLIPLILFLSLGIVILFKFRAQFLQILQNNGIEWFFPLKYRLIFGLTFFLVLGLRDLIKNPDNPSRAKEYLFVGSLSVLAMIFGILHDLMTFSISPEYFELAKGLGRGVHFFPEVFFLAIKGSYWVGILFGVLFIIVNNPSKRLQQVSYNALYKKAAIVFGVTICISLMSGLLSRVTPLYFTLEVKTLLESPRDFETVFIIHWATYLGATATVLIQLSKIFIERRKLLKV